MNWEALGASGELVGALLVIVSVIYLAQQVRQNTATSRSEVMGTISIEMAKQYEAWGSDQRSSELFHKIVYEDYRRADFSDTDMTSMSFLVISRLYLYEAAYRSYREGILTESEFLPMMASKMWSMPFLIDSWPIYVMEFSPDFVAYMEETFETLANARSE